MNTSQRQKSRPAASTGGDRAQRVRDYFAAWQSGDRDVVEEALADDFTFTSPYDDHIDRAAYFERCWPSHERIKAFELEVMADGGEAFVVYALTPKSGVRFRNVERHTFAGDKLKSVEVFFGDPPAEVPKERFLALLDAAVRAWKDGALDVK